MTPIVLAAAVACLPPDSPITAEAECFFGSRLTAIRALSTASRESGCTLSDTGDCICPAEPPARDVCDNWAVRVVASYRPSEADAFIGNLTAQLGEACKTYGGKVLEDPPPVPPDTIKAACDRRKAPAPVETSAITTVLAVATTAFAVTIFERTLADTATSPPRVQTAMNCQSALATGIVEAIQDISNENGVTLAHPTSPTADRVAASFTNEPLSAALYYSALRNDMSTYVAEMIPPELKLQTATVIAKLITLAEMWSVKPRL